MVNSFAISDLFEWPRWPAKVRTAGHTERQYIAFSPLSKLINLAVCIHTNSSIAHVTDKEEDPDKDVKEAFSEIRQVVTGQGDREGNLLH